MTLSLDSFIKIEDFLRKSSGNRSYKSFKSEC